MEYEITHHTTYRYEAAVSLSNHIAHIHPRETPHQAVLEFELQVKPEPGTIATRDDYYGNRALYLAIESPHQQFTVTARSRVRVEAARWPESEATPAWETVRDRCAIDTLTEDSQAGEFLFDSPHITCSEEFAAYAAHSFTTGRPLLAGLLDLMARIHRDFKFDGRATTVATPVAEVLHNRRGVCQDFAHLAICCLRSLGLPARYVSGYIETLPPPGGTRLVGADASHAWLAAWCPGFGWIDADPTNDLLPTDRHITLGWGRDYSDVSPVHGVVVGGGPHTLAVGIDVAPVQTSGDSANATSAEAE